MFLLIGNYKCIKKVFQYDPEFYVVQKVGSDHLGLVTEFAFTTQGTNGGERVETLTSLAPAFEE